MVCAILGILVVGVIFFIRNMKSNNTEQGIATVLFTTGISLILNAFGTLIDKVIHVLAMLKSESSKESIEVSKALSEVNVLSLITGLSLTIAGIYFSRYIHRKMFILNINGYYDCRIESNNNELNLSTFEFKEREVDFVRLFRMNDMNEQSAVTINGYIKEKVKSFKEESKHFQRGYTGIAPIPFIALAGTFLKREKIDKYFEYDKMDLQSFYLLKKTTGSRLFKWIGDRNTDYPKLLLRTDLSTLNTQKEEAVLSIAVTAEIFEGDLQQFNQAAIVNLSLDSPKDNAIQYEEQLIEYRNVIIETIYNIRGKLPNLKTVHLVCASQSCLALELGKNMEDYRMPTIILYQFNAQTEKKYPWGLVINGSKSGNFIMG